ncbi:hypothetical protein ACINKY_06485 [Paenibacillus illinoisensis]|uniref:Uncharacterized protein n=1 Tax=Paenibacillus illinoisensis TaxID=59845 RepID=A0ABW8HQB3_9BACL
MGKQESISQADNSNDPSLIPVALTAGVQDAFLFGIIIAIVGFILSLFIKRVVVRRPQ